MNCISYKLRSGSFLLLLVCEAGLLLWGVLLLVHIAGLSGGTGTSFFFFFPAALFFFFSTALTFPLAFFFSVAMEVVGGGVVSCEDNKENSMESDSVWFEPFPDLHIYFRIIARSTLQKQYASTKTKIP